MDAKRRELISEYKLKTPDAGVVEIKNTLTGKRLILKEKNLAGCENRFAFSKATDSCVNHQIKSDWERYGAAAFTLTVLKTVKRKEDEDDRAYAARLDAAYSAAADIPKNERY